MKFVKNLQRKYLDSGKYSINVFFLNHIWKKNCIALIPQDYQTLTQYQNLTGKVNDNPTQLQIQYLKKKKK